jgi:replicative DNA helicase
METNFGNPSYSPNQNKVNRSSFGRNNLLEKNEMGKLPPQAVEMEEAVLGALLIEKDSLTSVIDILKSDSFYKESNQKIFTAILSLFAKSEPIDLLTVTQQLRLQGDLEMVGGPQAIVALTNRIYSAANIEAHARIVVQSAIKRNLISAANEIIKDSYEDTVDVFTLLDKTEQKLFQISENNIRKNYENSRDVVAKAIKELEEKKNNDSGLTGIPSGFTDLDRLTSGWQPSELIIIAARPAMGKTALVVSAMRNAAVTFGHAVAIFSLEMSSTQLMVRLMSAEAEIDSEKLRKGTMSDAEWRQLHQKIDNLSNAPIFIDDTPALSILELRAKCRRLKAQHDIKLVIIDYLQLMTADGGGKGGGNREQEISAISRALKNLAKEINVPVIALSQLSRAVETRGGDKRPQLSDLRESGAIEQDADIVSFIYRPEYYKIDTYEDGSSTEGVGEIIIAKNRSGSVDTVKLRFIKNFTKFCDLDGFSANKDNYMEGFAPKPIAPVGLDHFEPTIPPVPEKPKTFVSKANTQPSNNDTRSFDDLSGGSNIPF